MTKLENNLHARDVLTAAARRCNGEKYKTIYSNKIKDLEIIAANMTIEEAQADA